MCALTDFTIISVRVELELTQLEHPSILWWSQKRMHSNCFVLFSTFCSVQLFVLRNKIHLEFHNIKQHCRSFNFSIIEMYCSFRCVMFINIWITQYTLVREFKNILLWDKRVTSSAENLHSTSDEIAVKQNLRFSNLIERSHTPNFLDYDFCPLLDKGLLPISSYLCRVILYTFENVESSGLSYLHKSYKDTTEGFGRLKNSVVWVGH